MMQPGKEISSTLRHLYFNDRRYCPRIRKHLYFNVCTFHGNQDWREIAMKWCFGRKISNLKYFLWSTSSSTYSSSFWPLKCREIPVNETSGLRNFFNHWWPKMINPFRHRTESTLVQIVASFLTTPSHYLNQCWLTICENISQEILKIHFLDTSLKISHLKLRPHLSGVIG